MHGYWDLNFQVCADASDMNNHSFTHCFTAVMDIPLEIRSKIVTLSEYTNLSQRKIASECSVSVGAVNNILKLHKSTGSIRPRRKGKCGRKKKTSARDDAMIIRMSKFNPRKTSHELKVDIEGAGVCIDSSTVSRRLLAVGRKARRPVKKPVLTDKMKKARYQWAKRHESWTIEDWRRVVFSDECHFEAHGFNSQFVRRSNGEPVRAEHMKQSFKHPPKQMFWGCFSYEGTGCLIPIEGMMNSDRYIRLIETRITHELEIISTALH